eukprot:3845174-Amphidinium_carterae.1
MHSCYVEANPNVRTLHDVCPLHLAATTSKDSTTQCASLLLRLRQALLSVFSWLVTCLQEMCEVQQPPWHRDHMSLHLRVLHASVLNIAQYTFTSKRLHLEVLLAFSADPFKRDVMG